MKITFQGLLTLGEESRISFREPLSYTSKEGIEVSIQEHDTDPNFLLVTFEIQGDTPDSVEPFVEAEMQHVASILSWKRGIRVLRTRIIGFQYSKTEGTHGTVVLAETIHMSDTVSIVATLSKAGAEVLANQLSTTFTSKTEEVLAAWREAMSQSSEILRYLFLYRLLESLGLKDGVDAWLRTADPNAPTVKDQNRDVSKYKYLRDHVHPKKGSFPDQEIKNALPHFQVLVSKAVTEKHPELTLLDS